MARLLFTTPLIFWPTYIFAANVETDVITMLTTAGMSNNCFAQCSDKFQACFGDWKTGCTSEMLHFGMCMGWDSLRGKTDWEQQVSCFIPDNYLRDEAMYCLLEEYKCINMKPTNASGKYPPSRDKQLSGDAAFRLDHLNGIWYKLQALKLGEPINQLPCGKVKFEPYTAGAVSWPLKEPEDFSKSSLFTSYLIMNDMHGKRSNLTQTAVFGPRSNGEGYPSKILNYGFMFGLTFWENYTVVHDGSQETEPFVVFYVWGETLSGEYPTAFTIGRTPTASLSLKKRMAEVLVQNGFAAKDWLDVDNSCYEPRKDLTVSEPHAGASVLI